MKKMRGRAFARRHRGLLIALGVWDTAWKAAAVWQAIKRHQYRWAAALGAVNSVGVLPMVYLWRSHRHDDGGEEGPDTLPVEMY